MSICKKCNGYGTVILRKVDSYCESCFLIGANHKFRACLGKTKTLSPNEKVLICIKGGLGSTVLLDLVSNGLTLDNHKKLRIIPYFLHLKGFENEEKNLEIAKAVIKMCNVYGFNVYVSNISDYIHSDYILPDVNTLPTLDDVTVDRFQMLIRSMPPTAQIDFLAKIKRKLFIRVAQKLECKFIFSAETTTTLAHHLLSNIATGRGSQVQNDIGFSDNRDTIKILRPIKDITKEELTHYVHVKALKVIHNQETERKDSLQSIISAFVTDLQVNFPATVSTICKTADKIGNHHHKTNKCEICESDLDMENSQLSALEATSFSRIISIMEPQHRNRDNITNKNSSLFPYIHKFLCYGCSRNLSEASNSELPSYILDKIKVS
ncbi:cytoplasmic tRNA 2-thiolation protein 2 [Amyelois transitella]|uniref:cytoplasmic tRNA 2-thiolation protein 2 n=1 Tax=Amyelois transitella TaxID=680683 RepID=UPI00067B52BF|nr:cytoplasmic tRNA 2-thiolation protein 2 [Amyelois transitella]